MKSKTIPNYELKSKVLKCGLVSEVAKINKSIYYANEGIIGFNVYPLRIAKNLQKQYIKEQPIEYHEAEKINHSNYKKVCTLKKKITKMLEQGQCIFLTLTFTDDTLNITNDYTRRRYIVRYLKSQSNTYIANIDFGKKNGREHYHALILSDNVDYSAYTYGAINGQKVRLSSNPKALAKYIAKLTNHAIKETNKRNVIIYSR